MSAPVSPSQPNQEPVRRCKHDVSEDCPACAEETIAGLKARAEQAENAVDLLESNARVQAKLLADTGRKAEELESALTTIRDCFWTDGETYAERLADVKEIALAALPPAVSR